MSFDEKMKKDLKKRFGDSRGCRAKDSECI